jgi:sec-independent protein translocase protein TatB
MLNIGTGEIIFIAVAALLILGPKKLPEFARTIGKLVRDFRRQTDDVRNTVEREFYKMDHELTSEPAPLPQPVPDAVAQGFHDGEAPAALPLPTGEHDASQVMDGTPPSEPVPLPDTTTATEAVAAPGSDAAIGPPVAPEPHPSAASETITPAVPEKASS